MKNSFKFIYIVAIVVTIMIVVTMGLFVMKSSQDFISTIDLTKYDIDEFNGIWKHYDGLQKGSALRGLFVKLKNNAEQNKNNPSLLVDLAYNTTQGSEFKVIKSTRKNPNIEKFDDIMNEIVVKHAYTVEFIYNDKTELITGILIKNHRNDKFNFIPDEN